MSPRGGRPPRGVAPGRTTRFSTDGDIGHSSVSRSPEPMAPRRWPLGPRVTCPLVVSRVGVPLELPVTGLQWVIHSFQNRLWPLLLDACVQGERGDGARTGCRLLSGAALPAGLRPSSCEHLQPVQAHRGQGAGGGGPQPCPSGARFRWGVAGEWRGGRLTADALFMSVPCGQSSSAK